MMHGELGSKPRNMMSYDWLYYGVATGYIRKCTASHLTYNVRVGPRTINNGLN